MKDWLLPTFGALFLWGLWSFIPKIAITYITPKVALLFEVLGASVVAIFVFITTGFRLDFDLIGATLSFLTGIFGTLGVLLFFKAISKGPVSLITVISSLYPIITVILAFLFLKESISLRQVLGIIFGIFAVYLITV